MACGNGNPQSSNRFTMDLSITGHDISHGVVGYECGLFYQKDTGAMNEYFADVFGIVIKQYHLKQSTDDSNWLLGERLWTPSIHGKALRSMKDPRIAYDDSLIGKDLQPSHMKDYKNIDFDHGGIHVILGILIRPFILLLLQSVGMLVSTRSYMVYVTHKFAQ